MSGPLAHLPADVFPLTSAARAALTQRPAPTSLPGMCVPGEVGSVPEPADTLDADERAALAEQIEGNLAPLGPHVRALDGVRALARPGRTKRRAALRRRRARAKSDINATSVSRTPLGSGT